MAYHKNGRSLEKVLLKFLTEPDPVLATKKSIVWQSNFR